MFINRFRFLAIASMDGGIQSVTTMTNRTFATAAPLVTIKQGQLKGKSAKNYLGDTFYSFRGIPYAKAPIKDLRFKNPQPPEPWSGIFNATKEGPECPSSHMIFTHFVGNENNCLNLNIYTKNLPDSNSKPKPVMVWIHGGGFVQGSNKAEFQGPEYLMMEDIVVVVINYRLGALGFLSVDDPSLDVPGNAGLKDQIAALKWVQENIEHFNGDKNNVTIFGESAGGASVHFLVLSPLAKGLFHKAIIQSGSALNYWAYGTHGLAELSRKLKYEENDEEKCLQYLRKLPAKKIVKASNASRDAFLPRERRFYAPVIEKPSPEAFISDWPENIIKSGNYNKVPMMIGYTSLEGMLLKQIMMLRRDAKLPKDFLKEVPFFVELTQDEDKLSNLSNEIKSFYYKNEEVTNDNIEKTYLLKTDSCFVHGIYTSIKYHRTTTYAPIYMYRMTVESSLNIMKKFATSENHKLYSLILLLEKLLKLPRSIEKPLSFRNIKGVCHADDLSYLWKMFWNPVVEPDSLEELYIKRFVKLWTNFAKYGNPTSNRSDKIIENIEWKPVDQNMRYLEIGETLEMKSMPDNDRMAFWDKLHEKYGVRKK